MLFYHSISNDAKASVLPVHPSGGRSCHANTIKTRCLQHGLIATAEGMKQCVIIEYPNGIYRS